MTPASPLRLGDGLAARLRDGPGDTVLWLHGYTMDSRVWDELWELLPGWRHVGVDLPCHGSSRQFHRGEGREALADTLADRADEVNARHLVALSFGTIIALAMAARRPAQFGALVLGAPSLAGAPQSPQIERRFEEIIRLSMGAGAGPHLAELWTRPPSPIFEGAARRPALWARLRPLIAEHRWSELGSGAMYALTGRPQAEADLAPVRAPTLLVVGSEEIPELHVCAERILRALPDSRRETIVGAGHLCLLEEPAAAAALIDAHLRRASPALRRSSS